MAEVISIINATLHNLKGVSLDIFRREFTCLAGPSGSGKSTLAVSVLFRACVDNTFGRAGNANLVRGAIPAVAVRQRLKVDRRLHSVAQFLGLGDYLLRNTETATPCHNCGGRGVKTTLVRDKVIVNFDQPLMTTALHPNVRPLLSIMARRIPLMHAQTSFGKLPRLEQDRLLFGDGGKSAWGGLEAELIAAAREEKSSIAEEDLVHAFYSQSGCKSCRGFGVSSPDGLPKDWIRQFAAGFFLEEMIAECLQSCSDQLDKPIGQSSLSQFQKLRIVAALLDVTPSSLVLLDEPCAGMARDDNLWVVNLCRQLKSVGCTVVVIEHSPIVILSADRVVEFGPGAGPDGGKIVCNLTQEAFRSSSSHLLAAIDGLGSERSGRKIGRATVRVIGGREMGLENVSFRIPEFGWTCIAGAGGTGKSGAIDLLFRGMDKSAGAWLGRIGIVRVEGRERVRRPQLVDQEPIGLNPRSIPLTYVSAMSALRDRFAMIAQEAGLPLSGGHFSFNRDLGWCQSCEGSGVEEVTLDGASYMTQCRACGGLRYRPEVLRVTHRGLSIGRMLQLSVRDLLKLLEDEPGISRKLSGLNQVGLGYLVVGQPSNALSGGESQRVKMSTQITKRLGDRTLYLLDTPSRGLSATDISTLSDVFQRLADRNTVVIADNHLGFVSACDWLIILEKVDGRCREAFAGPPHEAPRSLFDLVTGGDTVRDMIKGGQLDRMR